MLVKKLGDFRSIFATMLTDLEVNRKAFCAKIAPHPTFDGGCREVQLMELLLGCWFGMVGSRLNLSGQRIVSVWCQFGLVVLPWYSVKLLTYLFESFYVQECDQVDHDSMIFHPFPNNSSAKRPTGLKNGDIFGIEMQRGFQASINELYQGRRFAALLCSCHEICSQ